MTTRQRELRKRRKQADSQVHPNKVIVVGDVVIVDVNMNASSDEVPTSVDPNKQQLILMEPVLLKLGGRHSSSANI
jgi:hypothetical protein